MIRRMKVSFLILVLFISGCVSTSLNMRIRPPSYADCHTVSDLWLKSQAEINLSCTIN